MKILIVEDEKNILDLICLNLTKTGYECECTVDGIDAADKIISKSGSEFSSILNGMTWYGVINQERYINSLDYNLKDYIYEYLVSRISSENVYFRVLDSQQNTVFSNLNFDFLTDEIGTLALHYNRMADTIQEKIVELQDKTEAQQRFIDNFTHDLRTPLTAIVGYADYLRSAHCEEDEYQDMGQRIFGR